jgi:hypothetical protein
MYLLAFLQVPQAHGVVTAAGQGPPAVRGNGQAKDPARVADHADRELLDLKAMELLARF